MQVDKVDDERQIQAPNPGLLILHYFQQLFLFFLIEICIDDSIKKTFPTINIMNSYYMVQKVAAKEVNISKILQEFLKNFLLFSHLLFT